MQFKKPSIGDLNKIYSIYQSAIKTMLQIGIDQWDELYPSKEEIENDIANGQMLLGYFENKIVAAVTINTEQGEGYYSGNWMGENPVVVHRLCVDPLFQGKGIAKLIMTHIEDLCCQNGYKSIRLDAFMKNPMALKLYKSLGYKSVGFIPYRKGEFILFEKLLEVV